MLPPQAEQQQEQQPEPAAEPSVVSLADLDEAVLNYVLSRLPDPQALAATCTTLHAASRSPLCRQLWLARWWKRHKAARHRPLLLALLSWPGTRAVCGSAADVRGHQLPPAAPHTAQQEAPGQQQRHAHHTTTVASDSSSSSSSGVGDADCVPALLQMLAGVQCHMDVEGGAAGGRLPASSAATPSRLRASSSSGRGSGGLLEALLQQVAWPEQLLLPAAAAGGHTHLLRQLLAANAPMGLLQQSQQSQQGSQQHRQHASSRSQRTKRCRFMLPLPWQLAGCTHDVLQTSMLAAARVGALGCVQLLAAELAASPRSIAAQLDLLLAAAEAAAGGGHLACVRYIWQLLDSSSSSSSSAAAGHSSANAQPVPQQRAQERQQQHAGQPPQPAHIACLQRRLVEYAQGLLQAQPHTSVLQRLASASSYLLVAAASSGCMDTLDAVLPVLQPRGVKQQLPGALAAAGQRGHLGVLGRLLALQEMSSRPVQLAALDAATHGWPAPALDALLHHAASAHRMELVPLLAKPLTVSLQRRRQGVADALMNVLAEHACVEQPELLADPLLLLAHQGQAARVAWVLRVAPTVLIRLGQRAAAAALEGGHAGVAQDILDAGGERPPAFRAAAKRGELVAAVAAGDAGRTAELLGEVSLPLVWSCEAEGVGGAGGAPHRRASGSGHAGGAGGAPAAAAPGPAAAAGAGGAGNAPPLLPYHMHVQDAAAGAVGAAGGGAAGGAALAQQQQQQQQQQHEAAAAATAAAAPPAPTHCLATLLHTAAALADADASPATYSADGTHSSSANDSNEVTSGRRVFALLLDALRPVLHARSASVGLYLRESVLPVLLKDCLQAGRLWHAQVVLHAAGSAGSVGRAELVRQCAPFLQLPHHPSPPPSPAAPAAPGTMAAAAAPASAASAVRDEQWLPDDASRAAAAAAAGAAAAWSPHNSPRSPGAAKAAAAAAAAAADGCDAAVVAMRAFMQEPGWGSMLAACFAHSYLTLSHPGEYLGGLARPLLPAAFIPCLPQLAQLLRQCHGHGSSGSSGGCGGGGSRPGGGSGASAGGLPPGAVVQRGTAALFGLMVRTVLQACDVDVLREFLALNDCQGHAMLAGLRGREQQQLQLDHVQDVVEGGPVVVDEGGGGEGAGPAPGAWQGLADSDGDGSEGGGEDS